MQQGVRLVIMVPASVATAEGTTEGDAARHTRAAWGRAGAGPKGQLSQMYKGANQAPGPSESLPGGSSVKPVVASLLQKITLHFLVS